MILIKRKFSVLLLLVGLNVLLLAMFTSCAGNQSGDSTLIGKIESAIAGETPDEYNPVQAMLVIPRNPAPGEGFRILATGGRNIRKAKIIVKTESGNIESLSNKTGSELPCWRIDDLAGLPEGKYKAVLEIDKNEGHSLEFEIAPRVAFSNKGTIWKTTQSWDSGYETLYSAWINALFQGCSEQTSWPSLHEVTEDSSRNFLYNSLSLDEDNPESKTKVLMEPDCADNPFFLRAYFAWKLGLPFGYHISDRGWLRKCPSTGRWITNENPTSKSDPVLAFNNFLRLMMDGVHSGTARAALNNENADYYPVSLELSSLRPGTVFADPYGHTFVLVSWVPQTKNSPGILLAADAQPDGTVAIKRFWKGNFLFNTHEVIGEPGFKAFRPILFQDGKLSLMKNEELNATSGFAQFSLRQKNMEQEEFYRTINRLINPKPLDAGDALMNLITALHEQLLVRVKSVANGENYMKSHPGTVISMPSGANAIFQSGGQWEDFSTPNRDLRCLIAMDAVINFPDYVARFPEDFKISKSDSPEEIKRKLQNLLDKKVTELTIAYVRSDGSEWKLTLAEILKRIDEFEMAYNPNDCAEIRWGAPENSIERQTCKRVAPAYQLKTMISVRKWFSQRLHPPT